MGETAEAINDSQDKTSPHIQVIVTALSHLLRDGEGLFVETSSGKFLVHNSKGAIHVSSGEIYEEFELGRFVWVHDEKISQESDMVAHSVRKTIQLLEELSPEMRDMVLERFK